MSQSIPLNSTFPHDFGAVAEMPGRRGASPTMQRFSGVSSRADQAALRVLVTPKNAHPWEAEFVGFGEGTDLVSGIFSHPNPEVLLVVASGQAFLVNTLDRTRWLAVQEILPITSVTAVLSEELLVLSDFRKLAAYDYDGLAWKTSDVSYDGIKVSHVTDGSLFGLAWSAPADEWIQFCVDLQSGRASDGAEPV